MLITFYNLDGRLPEQVGHWRDAEHVPAVGQVVRLDEHPVGPMFAAPAAAYRVRDVEWHGAQGPVDVAVIPIAEQPLRIWDEPADSPLPLEGIEPHVS
jgi:hypothetical protein